MTTVKLKTGQIFLTKKDVITLVGYSSSHIDRLEAADKFPRRIRLGDNRVVWLAKEIEAWINSKIENSYEGVIM